MTVEEIDMTAAALEVSEKCSRHLLDELRDQIVLYGHKSKELSGRVFKFILAGRSVKVERVRRYQ